MKSIKEVIAKLGELLNRLIDSLLGQAQPEAELIPVPVEQRSRHPRAR